MSSTEEPVNAAATTAQVGGTAQPGVRRTCDFFSLDALLTVSERSLRDRVRTFVDEEVVPIITPYWERAEFPVSLLPKLARLGIVGGDIQGYGCPGLSAVSLGLIAAELSRGDASVSTLFGVQTGLVMKAIALCGSDTQKASWLPPLASLDVVGAFALTEPEAGSDAASISTRARRDGDTYVIDGTKRWVGYGHKADVILVWAREEVGNVAAFLVSKGTPGLHTDPILGKASMRPLVHADVKLRSVRVPAKDRLVHANDFRDTARVLAMGRCYAAWAALGQATACYEAARNYCVTRRQFGKPIGAHQLVQQKLAWMLTEITCMQLLCWRLGRLMDAGDMTPEHAAMAKLNNAAKARRIAADARDLMGGNGILLDNIAARHQADIEGLYSFEGTEHIQTLILGRVITGYSSFR